MQRQRDAFRFESLRISRIFCPSLTCLGAARPPRASFDASCLGGPSHWLGLNRPRMQPRLRKFDAIRPIFTGRLGVQALPSPYHKYLKTKHNYQFPGVIRRHKPGAVSSACFLRNTRPKTVSGACGKGASSLRGGSHSLMSEVRRRGHPRVVLSGKLFSGWRGARGSSIGAVALGGYRTLSR
jgi:hypothetical protein